MQMFVEHVFLPHSDVEGMLFFPRRLDIVSTKTNHFNTKYISNHLQNKSIKYVIFVGLHG